MTKACKTCGFSSSEVPFGSQSNGILGLRPHCKSCTSKKHKDYYTRNYKLLQDKRLRKNYGVSLDDYEAMLAYQGGVCFICNNPEPANRNLAIDHDHTTGQVRTLLCTLCNTALGLAKTPERCRQLAAYLEGFVCPESQ